MSVKPALLNLRGGGALNDDRCRREGALSRAADLERYGRRIVTRPALHAVAVVRNVRGVRGAVSKRDGVAALDRRVNREVGRDEALRRTLAAGDEDCEKNRVTALARC